MPRLAEIQPRLTRFVLILFINTKPLPLYRRSEGESQDKNKGVGCFLTADL